MKKTHFFHYMLLVCMMVINCGKKMGSLLRLNHGLLMNKKKQWNIRMIITSIMKCFKNIIITNKKFYEVSTYKPCYKSITKTGVSWAWYPEYFYYQFYEK